MIKKTVMSIGRRLKFSYFIVLWCKNWINPFLTLYINFAFLPFKQAIKLPIWIYSKTRFLGLTGKFIIETENVHYGMIRIGKTNESTCASGSGTEIINKSKIIFRGKSLIGCGCRILVYGKGILVFGRNFIMNNQNLIGCCNYIETGDNVIIGHRNQIADTNFHFMYNMTNGTVKNAKTPVIIGDYCWLTNNVSIMKGSVIPKHTTVASYSLLNRQYDVQMGTILAGIPAIPVAHGYVAIWNQNIERDLYKHFQYTEEEYWFPENIKLEDLIKPTGII
jgi:acetyltransferase-like isoleucine patch superfamily enzyme